MNCDKINSNRTTSNIWTCFGPALEVLVVNSLQYLTILLNYLSPTDYCQLFHRICDIPLYISHHPYEEHRYKPYIPFSMDKVVEAGVASGVSGTPKHVAEKHTGKNILPANIIPEASSRVEFRVANQDTPVRTSWLCIGAWEWRDEELPGLRDAWKRLLSQGVNFIDTAPAYGDNHASEAIVGQLVAEVPRRDVVVQTKYFGSASTQRALPQEQAQLVDGPVASLRASLARLRMDYVDIYLVHGPVHPRSIAAVAQGMARCVAQGLARAVGVANYDAHDVQRLRDELAGLGVPLATSQCEFGVLRRVPEKSGEIRECAEHDMVFQAAQSSSSSSRLLLARSNYHDDNDTRDVEPGVLAELRAIAAGRAKRSVAAVALNYNMSKGTLPVVGIRNVQQAEEALEALGWRLSKEEVVRIDRVALEGSRTRLWQQG